MNKIVRNSVAIAICRDKWQSKTLFLSFVSLLRAFSIAAYPVCNNTVNSDIFAIILFSRIALNDIFATVKIRDWAIGFIFTKLFAKIKPSRIALLSELHVKFGLHVKLLIITCNYM